MLTGQTRLLIRRELIASVRARWFAAYSLVFLLGGVILTTIGFGDTMIYGYRGFAKAFAGLVHMALLAVPLMALVPAVATIADERETGALEYLLAQPVTFSKVYAGKWWGVSLALLLSLTIAFGVAGTVAILRGMPLHLVLTLYAFVLLLALTFVAVGILLSTLVATRARAITVGLIVWLVLTGLGTLGVMIAFVRWGLPAQALIIWSFLNPVEAFRIGIVSVLDADLSLLGPVGAKIIDRLGAAGTTVLAAASLFAWTCAAGTLGWITFRKQMR